ncbi:MAG TPA: hypothetical protein VFS97_14020 [Nitrososphaeraceae archaeon]|nr:hypothetical protein [Nitrososphaeraceae archaeon]
MTGKNSALKPIIPLYLLLLFAASVLVMTITITPMTVYSSPQEVDSSDGSSMDNGDVDIGQDEEPSRLESEPGTIAPAPGPDPEGFKEPLADVGPPVCIDVFPPPPDCRIELPEPPVDDGPPVCIDVFPPPPGCGELPDDDCLFDPSLPKCAPPEDGKCPDGFLMNENGQCFPDKPCPPGYTKIDDDETGTCHPTDEEITEINIIIVNEINRQIRQIATPATTTCTPQEKTVTLGPSTMAKNGLRLLATFDPCRLTGGGAILNLPDSNNDQLKLVAVDLEGQQTHRAVVIDLQKVQQITNDQTLYNADFTRTITGLSAATNKMDTIRDINALVLWNDSPSQVNFEDDNSVVLNAILSK